MSRSGPEFYVLTLVPFAAGIIVGAFTLRAAQLRARGPPPCRHPRPLVAPPLPPAPRHRPPARRTTRPQRSRMTPDARARLDLLRAAAHEQADGRGELLGFIADTLVDLATTATRLLEVLERAHPAPVAPPDPVAYRPCGEPGPPRYGPCTKIAGHDDPDRGGTATDRRHVHQLTVGPPSSSWPGVIAR